MMSKLQEHNALPSSGSIIESSVHGVGVEPTLHSFTDCCLNRSATHGFYQKNYTNSFSWKLEDMSLQFSGTRYTTGDAVMREWF